MARGKPENPNAFAMAAPQIASEQEPKILNLSIGIEATGKRTESDSMGKIEVPS